jgi:hypothetical protein
MGSEGRPERGGVRIIYRYIVIAVRIYLFGN